MTTITYRAPKDDDKVVTFMGAEFYHDHPVSLDATGLDRDQRAALLAKAKKNPHFRVEESDDAEGDTPHARGVKAAEAGKKRNVPPAYRGKPEGEEWSAGYDSVAGEPR